ncbi:MAG: TetR/AcrR family transcriptional regulator [Chloroflexia bacterium]|nr:TetR/AcrR family transcriptional regulator [Chloroflexia bacterium]
MPELTDRQQEIILAAIHIIAEQGFQDLSLRLLAERVGVSEPALYRHFENKDDLLLKLVSFIVQNYAEVMREIQAPAQQALEELGEMLRRAVQFFDKLQPFSTTLYAAAAFYHKPEFIEQIQSVVQESRARIDELLLRGQQEGSVRRDLPSEQLATVILGAFRLLIEKWNWAQRGFDLAGKWEPLWATLKVLVAAEVMGKTESRRHIC